MKEVKYQPDKHALENVELKAENLKLRAELLDRKFEQHEKITNLQREIQEYKLWIAKLQKLAIQGLEKVVVGEICYKHSQIEKGKK